MTRMIRRQLDQPDMYAGVRRRMIMETELALIVGLSDPAKSRRIPIIEVGKGEFDPEFARAFWAEALELG